MTEVKHISEAEGLRIFNSVRAVATVARSITVDDARAYLNELNFHESIGPIIDPSSFTRGNLFDNIRGQRTLMAAYLTFRKAIQEITGE